MNKYVGICLSLFIIIVTLSLGAVGAASDNSTNSLDDSSIIESTTSSVEGDSINQLSASYYEHNEDINDKQINKINNSNNQKVLNNNKQLTSSNTKTINSNKTSKNLKKSINLTVNNYDELYDTMTNSNYTDDEMTINLSGDSIYNITKTINWNNTSTKNLIIEGNNRTFTGTNYTFLNIHTGNITLNNLTIKDITTNKVIIKNQGTLTISDSTLSDNGNIRRISAINNTGILTIINTTIINNTAISGGVLYNFGNATLINNIFINNSGVSQGGCIYNTKNGNITLIENIFQSNHAYDGGVIYTLGFTNVTNNKFLNNYGPSGVVIESKGNSIICNNLFDSNIASFDGGVIVNDGYSLVENNTIQNNRAEYIAGFLNNGGTVVLRYNTINNNTAPIGGVLANHGRMEVINNTIFNNIATNMGGLIYNYGYYSNITALIENNTIINNTAANYGGVVYNDHLATINLTNNIILNSNATLGSLVCAAGNSTVYIDNNTIVNQTASNAGSIFNTHNATVTLTNNNIYNSTAVLGGLVYTNSIHNVTLNGNNIQNTTANYGGVIYNVGVVVLNNNTIKNSVARTNSGLLYNRGNALLNGNTISNISSENAGLILNNKILVLNNNTITDNYVLNDTRFVIENYNTANITNNLFVNNTDNVKDMLLYSNNTENTYVSDNIYIDNLLNDTLIVPVNVTAHNNELKFNVTLNLREIYNDTIRNGTVTVYINDTLIDTFDVINGTSNITLDTTDFDYITHLKLVYTSLSKHYQNQIGNVTVYSIRSTIITVEPINSVVGEEITLIAHITDNNNRAITGGNLVFKINGKTLRTDGKFNSEASPLKFKVVNGSVVYTIPAELYLRGAVNVTASYSGTYRYIQNRSNVANASVALRNATVTVTVNPNQVNQDTDINYTVKVTDTSTDCKNTTIINDGYVIFKLNGITINDTDNSTLLVPVNNGTATYTYHVPRGTSAVVGNGNLTLRTYNVTATYINKAFNPSNNANATYNVLKSKININFANVTMNNSTKTLSIKANITDYNNNLVVGTNKICVKINGNTVRDSEGNVIYYYINNGSIDLSNINITTKSKINNITIVTGDREAYTDCRSTTSKINII